jgi:hypothetical protein
MKFRKPSIELLSNRILEAFTEPVKPTVIDPDPQSLKTYVQRTALKTASVSAALAIPGGVAGFVSMIPEIASIWRMQAQMVGSIAHSYGYEKTHAREQMIWCIFKQFGYSVVSKYVFQRGGVFVVKQMNSQAFQSAITAIGVKMIKHQGGKAATRIIPVAGSLASGALSYRDTHRVGKNALRLYSSGIEFD